MGWERPRTLVRLAAMVLYGDVDGVDDNNEINATQSLRLP